MRTLLLFFIFTIIVHADHVRWLGDYDKALQKSHNINKPLLVYLIKKDSKKCKDILKNNFFNQEYITLLNNKFIPLIITYESRQSYPIELFYTTSFPTLFFVDSKTETFLAPPLSDKEINPKNIKKVLLHE